MAREHIWQAEERALLIQLKVFREAGQATPKRDCLMG